MDNTNASRATGSSAIKVFHYIALVLVIIGAINWGLIGLFGFNVVDEIFIDMISRVIYFIVGIAGIVLIVTTAVLGPAPVVARHPAHVTG